MFSVFKTGKKTVRKLLGEFPDKTDANAVYFAQVYHETVEGFTGKLLIRDHTTDTEVEFIPAETTIT